MGFLFFFHVKGKGLKFIVSSLLKKRALREEILQPKSI